MTIKLNFTSTYLADEIKMRKASLNNKNKEGGVRTSVAKIITFLGTNKVFLYLSFSHLFTLVHELGHALSFKMITGKGSTITMSPNHCFALTEPNDNDTDCNFLTNLQVVWISLSGHLAIVLFSAIIILSIFALTHYLAMPLGLIIALRIIVAVPIILRILGEAFYVTASAYNNISDGDFGSIRQYGGLSAVFLSVSLLISILVLCLIGVVFLF